MQSIVTSRLYLSVPGTKRAWHILETEQMLALLRSARNAGLINQEVTERFQDYKANKLQESSDQRSLSIFLDQFVNIILIMVIVVAVISAFLDLQASRFLKNVITISAIDLYGTEEYNLSFLEGKQHLSERKTSFSNIIEDCGYALKERVDILFPYQTEAPRAMSLTELSVPALVLLGLKNLFIKSCFTP